MRLNAAPVRKAWFLLDGQEIEIATGDGSDDPAQAVLVTEHGQAWQLTPWRREGVHGAAAGSGAILAPMPGKVIAVEVEAGQAVTAGQKLLTLEAMKMEHTLTAPADGTVRAVTAEPGLQVAEGASLFTLTQAESE